jgi:hypothetical protein
MEKFVKKIHLAYYLIYTVTILSTIGGYIVTLTRETSVDVKSPLSVTLSSIVILYIIISIPAALAIFHRNTKKWALIEDNYTKLNKYVAGATWRLLAVGFGLVLSVVVFYILRTESMIFCAAITAIALLFCKPTEAKIINDLKLDDNTEE